MAHKAIHPSKKKVKEMIEKSIKKNGKLLKKLKMEELAEYQSITRKISANQEGRLNFSIDKFASLDQIRTDIESEPFDLNVICSDGTTQNYLSLTIGA